MKNIEEVDKNFIINKERNDGMIEYTMPHPMFDLYGVTYDSEEKRYLRMNPKVARKVSDRVNMINTNTSGGRIRFCTNAKNIELKVNVGMFDKKPYMTFLARSGLTLMEDNGNEERLSCCFMPSFTEENTLQGSGTLSGEWKEYILYFPLYNDVKEVVISLNEGAMLRQPKRYRNEKPILYYGSSITQGGCSSRPDTCYAAMIAKWNHIDFVNMGFSGSACGEREMAEYLAEQECSLFVCDYDHNAPNAEFLNQTHYRLYEIFRAQQPNVPILFITKPDARRDPFSKERAAVIYESYRKAKKQGDKNVYFLNGKSFYSEKDSELCSVDGIHPNDLGFYLMAKKIYAKMGKIDKKFL